MVWKIYGDEHFQDYNQVQSDQLITEAVAQKCSVKKVFLKISKNFQENTCARVSFFMKFQVSGLQFY